MEQNIRQIQESFTTSNIIFTNGVIQFEILNTGRTDITIERVNSDVELKRDFDLILLDGTPSTTISPGKIGVVRIYNVTTTENLVLITQNNGIIKIPNLR
ncbi:MAG: hypothetical protein R1F52_01220 [Candidatus Nitrosoabyssus spongiisocia]|nr:MAG: hypothetical protein R1F52_01220 [Nitrosopumilaceae archaeon AB1(1)]